MRIIVSEISEEGKKYSFSNQDTWFRDVIHDALEDKYVEAGQTSVDVNVIRVGREVFIKGRVKVPYHAQCDRCLEKVIGNIEDDFSMTLLPAPDVRSERVEEQMLEAEDLEVGYYRDDQFDIGELLREQFILDIPQKILCSKDCNGLCPSCGANLNKSPCSCEKPVDPRWAALKGLKPRA